VKLVILSTNVDVTSPGDTFTTFGDQSAGFFGTPNPGSAFDDTFTSFINGGSGISAAAGFAPWAGPAGATVTPIAGPTVVTGIRFYPGEDNANDDPANFTLEGSSNGGATYTTLASGSLTLPVARNVLANPVEPINSGCRKSCSRTAPPTGRIASR